MVVVAPFVLAVCQQGNTALLWASHNGHLPVMKSLLERGANFSAESEGSWTAMFFPHSTLAFYGFFHPSARIHIYVIKQSIKLSFFVLWRECGSALEASSAASDV